LALLFGIFLAITLYKYKRFDTVKTTTWFLWGFLGVLVSGCPSCSITFATYLGLSAILTVLPFSGLELKVIGIIILLFVIYKW